MYLCFECSSAIRWFGTVVNRRLIFCSLRFVARMTTHAVISEVILQAQFFVLYHWRTAAICKHVKTLALWPHMSFAKCGPTMTKCRHHHRRKNGVSVLNMNKSNESEHFYHRGSKTGLGLSTWMLNPASFTSASICNNSTMHCQICPEISKIDQNVREVGSRN